MLKLKVIVFLTAACLLPLTNLQATPDASVQPKPAIQQAKIYKAVNDINHYWISEKLDGMRGFWDGQQLLTRQGNIIHHPKWFTKHWPNHAIDGELWIGRSKFQITLSCVRKIHTDESCWRNVRFMMFDLPNHAGNFTERIQAMKLITSSTLSPYLKMIRQFKLDNTNQLYTKLNQIIANQGEGLMLQRGSAYYHIGRTSNIMKLKKHQDAEATVIAYIGGKGKYQGILGALKVKTTTGIVFKIGSGLSDYERTNPPPIGSIITFKYNGTTQAGIPRFARYMRIRKSEL